MLLAGIWGASFLSIRIALDEIGIFTTVAHRVFWAALLLWGVALLGGHSIPKTGRIWVAFFGMGLLNNVIPFSLIAWGQLYIETGLTSIFNASTAIFGVVLAALFFADEQLSVQKALGVLIGFCGVITVIGLDALQSFDIRSFAQIAIILGALSYGFAGIWAKKRLKGLPPQVAAAGMLTSSSLIMLPLAWFIEGPITLSLAPSTIGALVYISLIATAGAYLLYYRVLAMAGSGNLMLVTLLIVPMAIALGALVRGETLAPSAYAGFALLALGLLIIDGRIMRRLLDRRALGQ